MHEVTCLIMLSDQFGSALWNVNTASAVFSWFSCNVLLTLHLKWLF